MAPAITKDDVFDLEHPAQQHRVQGEKCRWFVTEFFTSGHGQKMASVRTLDGKHFATVPVERMTQTIVDAAGNSHVVDLPSLFHASNVETGGRAAAQAKFDAHQAIWLKRTAAERGARAAEARGDAAEAMKLLAEARTHDAALKEHCRKSGLCLEHI